LFEVEVLGSASSFSAIGSPLNRYGFALVYALS
jgi:hypothetical protein